MVGYDPVAMGNARAALGEGVELADSLLDAVTGADAAVIVTEWGEFRHLASRAVREAMATPLIVDGRNLLDPRQARAAGFAYESVGRPADPADVLRLAGIGRTPSRDRGRPGGRRGHAPSPPHVHDAQVDAADRQPAVPRASGRAPALARRRSDRARLWLQARRDPGPLRLGARVRRRGGAARHRRGDRLCRARSRHLRAVRRVQRRRPHRPRPDRAGRVPRRPRGAHDDRAAPGGRPEPVRGRRHRRGRGRHGVHREAAAGDRRRCGRSTRVRTSPSPTCST